MEPLVDPAGTREECLELARGLVKGAMHDAHKACLGCSGNVFGDVVDEDTLARR